jgi:nucleoside-diphosphate-sugar epimerase
MMCEGTTTFEMIGDILQQKQQANLPESVMIFGCGYVGTALAEVLLRAGVRVGALTRNPEKAAHLRELGVSEVLEAELASEAWHAGLTSSYAAVVNCVSSAGGGLEGYRRSYLEGQRSILRWAKPSQVRTFLFTSSTSVYPQDGGVGVDEIADTTGAPDTGQVLLQAERLLSDAAALFECWYVLRLAGIYGPGRHYLLDQLRAGSAVIAGSGDYTLNSIHRDDVVAAICAALSGAGAQKSGIYNIADDCPETKATVLHWLAGELGMVPPHFDPAQVSPRMQRRGGRMPDRKILNQHAKARLGWIPRYPDFRAGYRAILNQSPGQ